MKAVDVVKKELDIQEANLKSLKEQCATAQREVEELRRGLMLLSTRDATTPTTQTMTTMAERPPKAEPTKNIHGGADMGKNIKTLTMYKSNKTFDIYSNVVVAISSLLKTTVPAGTWFSISTIEPAVKKYYPSKGSYKNMTTAYMHYLVTVLKCAEHNGRKARASRYRIIPQKEMTEEQKQRKIEEERRLITER